MTGNFKIGLLLILLLIITTFFFRRYIYLSYQHLGAKVGINLNNIAKDEYKQWIQTQSASSSGTQQAIFLNQKVLNNKQVTEEIAVLGQNAQVDDSKWIEINLSEQKLYMKENGKTVGSFLISSGKWAPTPTGEWRIWTKLRYTRMTGGSKLLSTFYDLPNVPYTMYYNQGFGIHGTYWHNNFGHPMSHGCVNMKTEEAAIVYNWASVGTRVIVHN